MRSFSCSQRHLAIRRNPRAEPVEQMHMLRCKAQRHALAQRDMVVGEDARSEARTVGPLDGDEAFGPHILIGEELAGNGIGPARFGDGQVLRPYAQRQRLARAERPGNAIAHGQAGKGKALGRELQRAVALHGIGAPLWLCFLGAVALVVVVTVGFERIAVGDRRLLALDWRRGECLAGWTILLLFATIYLLGALSMAGRL
mgnify:CR=1 FL=1